MEKNKKNITLINEENIIENEDFDDTCDLNSEKICDSCGKCIETDVNYKIINITKIIK